MDSPKLLWENNFVPAIVFGFLSVLHQESDILNKVDNIITKTLINLLLLVSFSLAEIMWSLKKKSLQCINTVTMDNV